MSRIIVGNTIATPYPLSDSPQINEEQVVDIIRQNAQKYVNEDTTLPPSTEAMVNYVFSYCSVYGEDIQALRQEVADNYVTNEHYVSAYADHGARIENLETGIGNIAADALDIRVSYGMAIDELQTSIGDIDTALDAILAIHDELIGGDA